MKNYYVLIAILFTAAINAQIINFPDANFKSRLLSSSPSNSTARNLAGVNFKIDANSNGQIEQAEALQVSYLSLLNGNIISLEGISFFSNINQLYCHQNHIVTLDVTDLTNLTSLDCSNNQTITSLNVAGLTNLQSIRASLNLLETLDVSGLTSLQTLYLSGNQLTTLNTQNTPSLQLIYCNSNSLTSIDVSDSPNMNSLLCYSNQLTSLFIKNGKIENQLQFYDNPNLQYICCDESQIASVTAHLNQNGMGNCQVNSYCSFNPGGAFYTVRGRSKVDDDNNGCDLLDINYPNLKFNITDGTTTGSSISNISGNYNIPLQAGSYTITPVLENPSYFSISPTVFNVNFPADASPFTQDFCLTPTGIHNDLEVSIAPTGPARPGFDAHYQITYKNLGTTTQSGSLSLSFSEAVLDYISASVSTVTQSAGTLNWNFTDLASLETRYIDVIFNVNSPMETPPVNGNDVLNYNVSIASTPTDETPANNTFPLNQIVVNSFDPNDKACLEGATIGPAMIGQYVHYLIRFENTGTFPAENIVVRDMIDLAKFDINSLIPLSGSHLFETRISSGNKAEFIFENINLPFDDASNDGYVSFKIKTKPNLVVGNSFSNTASIYFDYNFPIVTDPAVTTISALETSDLEFSNHFTLWPNPVKNTLNISTKNNIAIGSISIYNMLGQLVQVLTNASAANTVDVSSLKTGNYLIKVNSDKGISSFVFIKQ